MHRNIKLTLAYDGTDFHGWQAQPGQQTVQGTVASLLHRLTGGPPTDDLPTLDGAGRTDAGVHAWGQVANFKTESRLTPGEFVRALNALLPPSIRIREAAEVPLDFHARWLACAKTYQYRICRGPVAPPFSWRYVLQDSRSLDFDAMKEAARCFEGEHDFSSFAASSGSEEQDRKRTTVRSVAMSQMIRCEVPVMTSFGVNAPASEEWIYVVRGKSFLRSMVRKMMGTLLEIGLGRMSPQDVTRLLELRDCTRSGPTAPAHGLCLLSVDYANVRSGEGLRDCAGQFENGVRLAAANTPEGSG